MLLFIERYASRDPRRIIVSIHLMLLFIDADGKETLYINAFQYISCYSLSNRTPFLVERKKGFNTSHVTLYRAASFPCIDNMDSFNTSHVTLYLNTVFHSRRTTTVSIHLMLLFILMEDGTKHLEVSFNTSHVTLYQRQCRTCKSPVRVSIHLMLLFISKLFDRIPWNCSFNTSHVTLYPLYFTAFLTPNIFIIPQNTMHCKIFTRRLDNSLFWD